MRISAATCRCVSAIGIAIGVSIVAPQAQVALGSAISYQGRLTDAGAPASGSYDLRFTLFDAVSGGNLVGSVVTAPSTPVSAGVFTVALDFGPGAFNGSARWIEVAVRPGGSTGAFTTLAPRQALLANPHAIYAVNAGTAASATNATQLAGQGAAFYLNLANSTGTLGVAQGGTGATSTAASPFLTKTIGACGAGTTLQTINPDGTVVCAPAGFFSSAVIDSSPGTGENNISVVGGTDGLGLISYFVTTDHVHVAHCSNPACSSATSIAIDPTNTNDFSGITLGNDGLGLVSYRDVTTNSMKVAHCSDTPCSAVTIHIIDTAPSGFGWNAITMGADGLGLVAYTDLPGNHLRVAHCGDIACTTATKAIVDSSAEFGYFPSIAMGADGRGLIAYRDMTNFALKVAHCNDAACSSVTSTSFDAGKLINDSLLGAAPTVSAGIGADGLGLIAYADDVNRVMRVAHCANAACTSATISTIDNSGNVGPFTSMTVGPDGLGVVLYILQTVGHSTLQFAHCSNAVCGSATTVTVGTGTALSDFVVNTIAIGGDNLPLLAYGTPGNGTLTAAHCGNATTCLPTVAVHRR